MERLNIRRRRSLAVDLTRLRWTRRRSLMADMRISLADRVAEILGGAHHV